MEVARGRVGGAVGCAMACLLVACGASPTPPVARGETEPSAEVARVSVERAPARAQRLASRGGLTCRIDARGRVVCWGPAVMSGTPTVLEALGTDAVQIVMGGDNTVCARGASGSVACQHGSEPGLIEVDIDDAVEIAAQHGEWCAVRRSGAVSCWGYGWARFRAGSWRPERDVDADWSELTPREGLHDAIALRAPPDATEARQAPPPCWCALRRGGAIRCWGRCAGVPRPASHEVHDPSFPNMDVESITGASDLELTENAMCVLVGGRVLCAGEAYAPSDEVVVVLPGSDRVPAGYTEIAGTEEIVRFGIIESLRTRALCGATADGRHLCWEAHDTAWFDDQREEADTARWDAEEAAASDEYEPTVRETRLGWDQLASSEERSFEAHEWERWRDSTEVVSHDDYACALRRDDTAVCWGSLAGVGRGRVDASPVPVRVEIANDVVEIVAGNNHTCARSEGGSVSCWGHGFGAPHRIAALSPAARVFASDDSTCVLDARARARCIDGMIETEGEAAAPFPARSVSDISAGSLSACWVERGRPRCAYRDYEAGDAIRQVPVPFSGAVVEMVGAIGRTYVRDAEGNVSSWGSVSRNRATVEVLPVLTGASAIAAGAGVCAVVSGHVFCTGREPNPTERAPIDDAVDVAMGGGHTCAVRAGGTVVCWGAGRGGQTGRGRHEGGDPEPVVGIDDARMVVAGELHTCALRADRSVYCWGVDGYGQLGSPREVFTDEPLLVAEAP